MHELGSQKEMEPGKNGEKIHGWEDANYSHNPIINIFVFGEEAERTPEGKIGDDIQSEILCYLGKVQTFKLGA